MQNKVKKHVVPLLLAIALALSAFIGIMPMPVTASEAAGTHNGGEAAILSFQTSALQAAYNNAIFVNGEFFSYISQNSGSNTPHIVEIPLDKLESGNNSITLVCGSNTKAANVDFYYYNENEAPTARNHNDPTAWDLKIEVNGHSGTPTSLTKYFFTDADTPVAAANGFSTKEESYGESTRYTFGDGSPNVAPLSTVPYKIDFTFELTVESEYTDPGFFDDGEVLNGVTIINVDKTSESEEVALSISGTEIKPNASTGEEEMGFRFRSNGIQAPPDPNNFKNGFYVNGDLVSYLINDAVQTQAIDPKYIKYGESNTISISVGNGAAPYDESKAPGANNYDDFSVWDFNVVLPDGSVVTPSKVIENFAVNINTPASVEKRAVESDYSSGSKQYAMGDGFPGGSNLNVPYRIDLTFDIPEANENRASFRVDTAEFPDGEHTLTLLRNGRVAESATVIIDNTAPVVIPSIGDGATMTGEFALDATAGDATTEVVSITASLNGRAINLPYATSETALGNNRHTFVITAIDKAGNQAVRTVMFITGDGPAVIIKNVALQVGADETKRNLVWYSNAVQSGKVQLALASGSADSEFPEIYRQFDAVSGTTGVQQGFTSYKAQLSGLEAETEYIYRVGDGKSWSPVYSFRTNGFDDSYSFLVAGDPQIGASNRINDAANWNANISKATDEFPDSSFLITVGDQVSSSSSEAEYDAFLGTDILKEIPLAVVPGNHDAPNPIYAPHYNMPNQTRVGSTSSAGDDGDYWYIYNNTLFMGINIVNTDVEAHKQFLRETIEAHPDVKWKVVILHYTLFSITNSGYWSVTGPVRDQLAPALSELGIDVAMAGHDHSYVRTYMMEGVDPVVPVEGVASSVTDPPENQVLYVNLNSSSGSLFVGLNNTEYPFLAVKNQEYVPNITKVDVTDDSFTITTYRTTDMSVVDEFTIFKTDPNEADFQVNSDRDTIYSGSEVRVNASFGTVQESNITVLTYKFDADKFDYKSFEPAEGVHTVLINRDNEAEGVVKVTVMVPGYNAKDYGEAVFAVRGDTELGENENLQITVDAEYVLRSEDGGKEIKTVSGSVEFTSNPGNPGDTNGDGKIDLVDLSNVIDLFGENRESNNWEDAEVYDFNSNGEIDINDIAQVAMQIG